jgi:hypothetical protein
MALSVDANLEAAAALKPVETAGLKALRDAWKAVL